MPFTTDQIHSTHSQASPTASPAKIKSISGQMITWVNEHCNWINPENPRGCSVALGPFRGVARLVVGAVCGFFGGIAGVIWHGGCTLKKLFTAITLCSSNDLIEAGEHFFSFLSDLYRITTLPVAIHYALAPDHFFSSNHPRRSVDDPPVRIEAIFPLLLCGGCIDCAQAFN